MFTPPHTQMNAKRGFTLVELMVSIAIFSIITTVAVLNNSKFNSSVLLTNLAYEVALSVRQAQVYGVTVRKDATGNFNSAYGVHFEAATPTTYILFEDRARDHVYSPGVDTILETIKVEKGNSIGRVCTDGGLCGFGDLDITFERPNPDAFVRINNSSTIYHKAEICIASPQGIKRKVVVEETGQISVTIDTLGVCESGQSFAYEAGYEGGYESSYTMNYEGGYQSNYENGYENGYQNSYENSYESGYENSYENNYESSYESGYGEQN